MNPVLKTNKLETIFEHGVTDNELSTLFYGAPEPENEYRDGLSHDGLLVDIVRLYQLRGNTDAANRYLSLIEDASIRSELATRGCCTQLAPTQRRMLTPPEIEALQQDKLDSFEKMSRLYDELMQASDKASSEAP